MTNLSVGGVIHRKEVTVFERLLGDLRLNQALAVATAEAMPASQRNPGIAADSTSRPMPLTQIDAQLPI